MGLGCDTSFARERNGFLRRLGPLYNSGGGGALLATIGSLDYHASKINKNGNRKIEIEGLVDLQTFHSC